jgi:hypothetical protein
VLDIPKTSFNQVLPSLPGRHGGKSLSSCPGEKVIKLFSFVIDAVLKSAGVFAIGKYFQPTPKFNVIQHNGTQQEGIFVRHST